MREQERVELGDDEVVLVFIAHCGTALVKYYAPGRWRLRGSFRGFDGNILPEYEKLVGLPDSYEDPDEIYGNYKAEVALARKAVLDCYPEAKIEMVREFDDDGTYIIVNPEIEAKETYTGTAIWEPGDYIIDDPASWVEIW